MQDWGLLGTRLDLQSCLILAHTWRHSVRTAPPPGLLQWTDGLTSAAKVCLCEAGACFPSLAFLQIYTTQLLQVDVCSVEAALQRGREVLGFRQELECNIWVWMSQALCCCVSIYNVTSVRSFLVSRRVEAAQLQAHPGISQGRVGTVERGLSAVPCAAVVCGWCRAGLEHPAGCGC